MIKSKIFTLLFLTVYCTYLLQAQIVKTNEVILGIGLSQPDIRSDFLEQKYGFHVVEIARNDRPLFEYDYFISYNKIIYNKQEIHISIGAGYLLNINYFGLPINNSYFGIGAKILLINNQLLKHNFNFPIEGRYKVLAHKNNSVQCIMSLNNNFNIIKQILLDDFANFEGSVRKFSLSDFELNSGLRYETEHFAYSLQFRLLNVQFKDDALANNGKEVDLYNPFKFKINIGRRF